MKKNYIDLYNKFEQNKLIAMKSARLADIILKTPETLDANIINSVFNVRLKIYKYMLLLYNYTIYLTFFLD